jgi:hypothetical protein
MNNALGMRDLQRPAELRPMVRITPRGSAPLVEQLIQPVPSTYSMVMK